MTKKTLHKQRVNEYKWLDSKLNLLEMITFLSVTVHNLTANDATDILEMAASLIVMFHRLCNEKKGRLTIHYKCIATG